MTAPRTSLTPMAPSAAIPQVGVQNACGVGRALATLASSAAAIAVTVLLILSVYGNVFGATDLFVPVEDANTPQEGVAYISELIEGNTDTVGVTRTELAWDDAWFAQDPYAYNHDLARAAVVLCAVINSESVFYQGNCDIDFVAQALGGLGFSNIETSSFEKRSEVGDELGAIVTGTTDVVAYALAHKELPGGAQLVFVGARGTYGSEWLSNFRFASDDADPETHAGFGIATHEILAALDAYCTEQGIDPAASKILVCGHSRGGAVANLLAATLDAQAAQGEGGFPSAGIYAYTFACPNLTCSPDAANPLFGNIFNVVNPTDLVPRIPLFSWGYAKFGITVELPSPAVATFDARYAAMQAQRAANTGFINAGRPFTHAGGNYADAVEASLAAYVEDPSAIMTAEGFRSIIYAFWPFVRALSNVSLGQVVASHYPDTYLAWMQVTPPEQLSFW